jgi:hypothetical protein
MNNKFTKCPMLPANEQPLHHCIKWVSKSKKRWLKSDCFWRDELIVFTISTSNSWRTLCRFVAMYFELKPKIDRYVQYRIFTEDKYAKMYLFPCVSLNLFVLTRNFIISIFIRFIFSTFSQAYSHFDLILKIGTWLQGFFRKKKVFDYFFEKSSKIIT